MSTDRDVTRIVRSWLKKDAHEDADRVLNLVLDQLDTTPQRRVVWPVRRILSMSSNVRFGLVAAAIVVAIVVGIGLFNRPSVGGPAASPTPTVAPTVSPTPSIPMKLSTGVRYRTSNFSVPFSFAVPANGWTMDSDTPSGADVSAQGNSFYGLTVMTGISVYKDPCHWDLGYVADLGSLASVDGIVAALGSLPGFTASQPVAVTVAGHAGFAFDLAPPSDASGCTTPGKVRLLDSGDPNNHDEFFVAVALHYQIIDVGGTPVVLEQYSFDGAARLADVQKVVDGITFE